MAGDLEILGGPAAGQRIPVNKAQFVIGYDSRCDIYLQDGSLSGVQAIIYVQGPRHILVNQSPMGTNVNNTSVSQIDLRDGDIISFAGGRFNFRFLYNAGLGLQGIIPKGNVTISFNLHKALNHPAQKYILIGCGLILIAAFLPFFSYHSVWGSGSIGLPFTYRLMIGLIVIVLSVLSFMEAYIFHLIVGILGCLSGIAVLFTSGDAVLASAGPGIAVFIIFAGNVLITYGGYKGFNIKYHRK